MCRERSTGERSYVWIVHDEPVFGIPEICQLHWDRQRIDWSVPSLVRRLGNMVKRRNRRQYGWAVQVLREPDLSVPLCRVPGHRNIDVNH